MKPSITYRINLLACGVGLFCAALALMFSFGLAVALESVVSPGSLWRLGVDLLLPLVVVVLPMSSAFFSSRHIFLKYYSMSEAKAWSLRVAFVPLVVLLILTIWGLRLLIPSL